MSHDITNRTKKSMIEKDLYFQELGRRDMEQLIFSTPSRSPMFEDETSYPPGKDHITPLQKAGGTFQDDDFPNFLRWEM